MLDKEKNSREKDQGRERAMQILANSMPWIISLLFHVGLFLVMFFLVFMIVRQPKSEGIIIPDAVMSETPSGVVISKPYETELVVQPQSHRRKQFRRATKISVDMGKTQKTLSILSPNNLALSSSAYDLGLRTSDAGTKSSFFGTGGNAHNIVYVIDRSGSMLGLPWDLVKNEVLRSIGRLKAKQTFHIILFASGDPIEKKPARLVPATMVNKRKAANFMKGIVTESATNPIPALERAFAVLKNTRKPGKLVYLLTDGNFPDNAKVLKKIGQLNKDNDVLVNTVLFMFQPSDSSDGSYEEKINNIKFVMQKIAEENGGRFKFVSFDD